MKKKEGRPIFRTTTSDLAERLGMPAGGAVNHNQSATLPHTDSRGTGMSGKAKKRQLQQNRERQRERSAQREALANSDERLGNLTEKLIRAHCFVDTGRGTRAARVLLRLRLVSMDVRSSHQDDAVRQPAPPPPPLTAEEKAEKAAKASIAKVRSALSSTVKQRPRDAADTWRRACASCHPLLLRAAPPPPEGNEAAEQGGSGWSPALCTELFLALQQAMQSGPLQASKTARFALLRKWVGNDACGQHPDVDAPASLLDAAEAAIAHQISWTENQRMGVQKWRKEFLKAFPPRQEIAAGSVCDAGEPDADQDQGVVELV